MGEEDLSFTNQTFVFKLNESHLAMATLFLRGYNAEQMKNFEHSIRNEDVNKPLTVEYARKVLFLSYRYSQQNTRLQQRLFRYLHKIRPEWRIPNEDFKKELQSTALKQFSTFVIPKNGLQLHPLRGRHEPKENTIDEADIASSIEAEISSMENVLNDIPPSNPDSSYGLEWSLGLHLKSTQELIPNIVTDMLSRDGYYLLAEGGRDRAGIKNYSPQSDRWSSHVIDYALKRNPAGLPEYNKLFSDVRAYILSPERENDWHWSNNGALILADLLDVYGQNHTVK